MFTCVQIFEHVRSVIQHSSGIRARQILLLGSPRVHPFSSIFPQSVATLVFQLCPLEGGGAFCRYCLLFSHELHNTCTHIHKIHRKNFIGEIVIFFWSLVFALRPTSPVCAGLACVLFSSQQCPMFIWGRIESVIFLYKWLKI